MLDEHVNTNATVNVRNKVLHMYQSEQSVGQVWDRNAELHTKNWIKAKLKMWVIGHS